MFGFRTAGPSLLTNTSIWEERVCSWNPQTLTVRMIAVHLADGAVEVRKAAEAAPGPRIRFHSADLRRNLQYRPRTPARLLRLLRDARATSSLAKSSRRTRRSLSANGSSARSTSRAASANGARKVSAGTARSEPCSASSSIPERSVRS